jgi:hypothetical protein
LMLLFWGGNWFQLQLARCIFCGPTHTRQGLTISIFCGPKSCQQFHLLGRLPLIPYLDSNTRLFQPVKPIEKLYKGSTITVNHKFHNSILHLSFSRAILE